MNLRLKMKNKFFKPEPAQHPTIFCLLHFIKRRKNVPQKSILIAKFIYHMNLIFFRSIFA